MAALPQALKSSSNQMSDVRLAVRVRGKIGDKKKTETEINYLKQKSYCKKRYSNIIQNRNIPFLKV